MDISRRKFGASILAGLATRALALPPRPKLLVLLILEQFRPDYLDDVWAQIGTGGMRRIIEGGAFFPDCRHVASTFTSTSLATIATGTWPAQHGIVADTWYDRTTRKPVGASAEELRATTLTAQIASVPATRSFIVSLEPLEAALFAGTPSARLFWLDADGNFATGGTTPDWLSEYNRLRPLQNLHGSRWLALGARPDAPALRTLTYDPARPQEFLTVYKASPFAQQAQFDFAAELLERERLGQTNAFDFLVVLCGSSSLLGYEVGARSPLMQQMTLQLDRQIESFLGRLDRAPGGNMYNLVLAGGHGAPPLPDAEARSRMAVNGELLAQAIQQKLTANGAGHVDRYLYPFLYLDTQGFPVPELSRSAAGRVALEQPAVAAYCTTGGEASVHDDWQRRFLNSLYPGRSGDVMLSYRPEYIEDYPGGRGVSYGSLYNYDTRTPLCFYGPQFHPRVIETPVESVDIAPTLARAIGVAPPSSSLGHVLGEAFAGPEDSPR